LAEPVRITNVTYRGYYKFLRAGSYCLRTDYGYPLELGTWNEVHWDRGAEGSIIVEWIGGEPPYTVVSEWAGRRVTTENTTVTIKQEITFMFGGPFLVTVTDKNGASDWWDDYTIHYGCSVRHDFRSGCGGPGGKYCEEPCRPTPDGRLTLRISSGGSVLVDGQPYRGEEVQKVTVPFDKPVAVDIHADTGYKLDSLMINGRPKHYTPVTVVTYGRDMDVFAYFRRVEVPRPPEKPPEKPARPPSLWEAIRELLRKILGIPAPKGS
jgi:hypothetical protein